MCAPLQRPAGPERGGGQRPEPWTPLPGARLPDVGRVRRPTEAHAGLATGEQRPAGAPGSGREPGRGSREGVTPGWLH